MNLNRDVSTLVIMVLSSSMILPVARGSGFHDVSSWAAYDPGDHGVGTDPDGYCGAAFDGRYVYFAPLDDEMVPHGEVLRHDTLGAFDAATSWEAFDPGANGVGTDPDGYAGAVFDGRYVYFAPRDNGTQRHGEVLRFDTTGAFSVASSWATFDAGANGVGNDPTGFWGAVFDGRYVYFVPEVNETDAHGEVLRYDTMSDFETVGSWAAFDAGANGVGTDPDGYNGGVFGNRYVYFAPNNNGTTQHGEVLRFDTQGAFDDVSSWDTYDPGANGVGVDPDGYDGAVFDGRYVYFNPTHNGSHYHNEVLRYDTAGDFRTPTSWTTFDPGAYGVGYPRTETHGIVFDGRYVYLVPFYNGIELDAEVIRYDTEADFTDPASWDSFDAGDHGVGDDPDGFHGGVFDGRYVYFVPLMNGTEWNAEVLRYDTMVDCNDNDIDDACDLDCGPGGGQCDVPGCGLSLDINETGVPDECEPPIPTLSEWATATMALLMLTAGTIVLVRRRIVHYPNL